jgi:hypothetical protein
MTVMTAKKLKELMERVEHWPPEAQEEALASLETIEEESWARTSFRMKIVRRSSAAPKMFVKDVLRPKNRSGRFSIDIAVHESSLYRYGSARD